MWKVFDPEGNYVGSAKHVELAAAMVNLLGENAKIKWGHSLTVWREGFEGQWAGSSYDLTAKIIDERIENHRNAVCRKRKKRVDKVMADYRASLFEGKR
jgi:hypothetical protein